jgi:leader peptidase (prepilin peptidase)/N-methyltransferase
MPLETLDSFMYAIYAIAFVFGSLFGSFFNVCIYRIPRVHFTLTSSDIQALAHSRDHANTSSIIKLYLVRPFLWMLQFLGLHPGKSEHSVPADIQTQLTAIQDRDHVSLNDFADALDSLLGEEHSLRYGDAILQQATRRPESIIFPASHCPGCQTPIKPWDNIPILSFLLLKGQCRACGTKISWRYPLLELLTALLYVGILVQFGFTLEAFVYLIFGSLLIIISFIDIDHQLIPDVLSVPGILLGIIVIPLSPIRWHDSLLGILVGGGIIWLTGFVGKLVFKKEAMGGGDIKLMAMIGAFLGWKMVLMTIFFGSITGAVLGILFKLLTGKEYIPFGPFLSIGALLSLFVGQQVLFWYWGQFFFQ